MAAGHARNDDVRSLGQAQGFRSVEAGHERADVVNPGARRIDPVARRDLVSPAGEAVVNFGAHDRALMRAGARGEGKRADLSVVRNYRAVLGGVENEFQCEARVVGLRVVIDRGGAQALALKRRNCSRGLVGLEHAMAVRAPEVSEQIVKRQAEADLERVVRIAVIYREQEGQRASQVRRELAQPAPLGARFVDEPEIELLEITQPAVDELGRAAGSAAGKILGLNQRHLQAAQRRLARRRRAVDAAAYHHQIEVLVGKRFQVPLHKSPLSVRNRLAQMG